MCALTWSEENQRYLLARMRYAAACIGLEGPDRASLRAAVDAARSSMSSPPALDRLAAAFRLSEFECELLVLCAAVELDREIAERCARTSGAAGAARPSFSLALQRLPGAHWTAVDPLAPLRWFRLISVGAGDSFTTCPLQIDERVLHYLAGVDRQDQRLAGILRRLAPSTGLAPSQRPLAACVAALLVPDAPASAVTAAVAFQGTDRDAIRSVVVAAAKMAGRPADLLDAMALACSADPEGLAALVRREALLADSTVLVEVDDRDDIDPARAAQLRRLMGVVADPLLLSCADAARLTDRSVMTVVVPPPTRSERLQSWRASRESLPAPLAAVSAHPGETGARGLIERLESRATWDDLVLHRTAQDSLHELAGAVRQRSRVHRDWGFDRLGSRGLGLGALFVGPSGTGKTMAAEVLAGDLDVDLYRVDLSQSLSKFIGETERNLARVFDAAERDGTILLFDEGEALLGRRTEVRDSHDRYANVEIAYVLQRIETYRGLVIVTTNSENDLDPAFLRRLRFVVRFQSPCFADRVELWRRVFPPHAPVEALDLERLASMELNGGSIRNVGLRAAYRAAGAGGPITMEHLLEAAQVECEALGTESALRSVLRLTMELPS